MGLIYSLNGFPVLQSTTPENEGGYHDPRIDALAEKRAAEIITGVADDLDRVTGLFKILLSAGNPFKAALLPEARFSSTIRDFLGDTATYITKATTRRSLPLAEMFYMVGDDIPDDRRAQQFAGDRLAAISTLATLELPELFQMWLVNTGVDDISRTLQLYVGKRLN